MSMGQTIHSALADTIVYLDIEDRREVLRGLAKAIEWHEGQLRSSGQPYVEHPIAVAEYLASLKAGRDTLIAALLHDVVEDERATLEEVRMEFGPTVAKLVDGVTKLSKLKYEGKRVERQLASLRKMLLTAHEDLRVIFIKLADRLHNVQTIGSLPQEKQERIAHETLEIYVPFARLVGLWEFKRVFETVCFPLAFPAESALWHERIDRVRLAIDPEREDFVRTINAETSTKVEAHIDHMTDYEIYQKLQRKVELLKDVGSIDSIHIVIQDDGPDAELGCYVLLGQVHKKYQVLPDGFHDYISTPQANGYRALHTTVFIAQNHVVRLRIQTKSMHDYSTRRKLSDWAVDPESNLQAALSALNMANTDEKQYLDDLKSTVLAKRINIFTTMGEIVSLPSGSTGVDFAYAVNPGCLRYLEAMWVNGERVEATHPLKDGDTAEPILLQDKKATNGNGHNKVMWLNKVQSVEAREGLKKSLQDEDSDTVADHARRILIQELGKERLSGTLLFRLGKLQQLVAHALHKPSFDVVLAELGSGLLSVSSVIEAYKHVVVEPKSKLVRVLNFFHLLPRSRVLSRDSKTMNIEVYAQDRRGLIHDITRCFALREINVAKFGVFALPRGGALYKIRLEAKDFSEFSDLFDALLQVPSVTKVLRKR